ncbi:MAG: hypothetical protein HWE27_02755 [Gammaproteobacteria bacterium]|nr:hypothetical protein [Gammaproteobacteria bacterium]
MNKLKTTIIGFVATICAMQVAADEKEKEPSVPHDKVEHSKLVAHLINKAEATMDPVLYMAAGKLIDDIAPVTILKKTVKDAEKGKVTDADVWTASDLYTKAAKIAGQSEMGKQAQSLAESTKQKTNAEGCLGYNHYHYIWWYDAYGNYHYRYVWHYC